MSGNGVGIEIHDGGSKRHRRNAGEGKIGAKTLVPLGIVAAVAVAIVSIAAWLFTSLAAKADAAAVGVSLTAHTAQLMEHAIKIQQVTDDNAWIKATLYEMARHQGLQVTAPPQHQP